MQGVFSLSLPPAGCLCKVSSACPSLPPAGCLCKVSSACPSLQPAVCARCLQPVPPSSRLSVQGVLSLSLPPSSRLSVQGVLSLSLPPAGCLCKVSSACPSLQPAVCARCPQPVPPSLQPAVCARCPQPVPPSSRLSVQGVLSLSLPPAGCLCKVSKVSSANLSIDRLKERGVREGKRSTRRRRERSADSYGETRGVMVSTSAFLACHQCWIAGSSLGWGLNFSGFSMWHFLRLVVRDFLRVLRFPPLLHRLIVSAK